MKIIIKSKQTEGENHKSLPSWMHVCVAVWQRNSSLIFLLLICLWIPVLCCLCFLPVFVFCLSFRSYRYSVYSSPARRILRYR